MNTTELIMSLYQKLIQLIKNSSTRVVLSRGLQRWTCDSNTAHSLFITRKLLLVNYNFLLICGKAFIWVVGILETALLLLLLRLCWHKLTNTSKQDLIFFVWCLHWDLTHKGQLCDWSIIATGSHFKTLQMRDCSLVFIEDFQQIM